jgi:hypothetical protein
MFNAVLYCGEIETKKGQTITSCSSIDVLNLTRCSFDVMELICLMEQDFDTSDVRSSLSNFDPTKEKKLLCKHAHKEISLNRREKLYVDILTQEIKPYVRN